MPDYKESAVTGTAWQRCPQVVISNPLGGVPTIRFDEERITALDTGRSVHSPRGNIAVTFNAEKVISLIDPATGIATGQSTTYGDAYVLLYSAYLAAALDRDAAAEPAPAAA